jgi:hypothetical protein
MCDLFLTAIITVIFFTVFVQVLGLGWADPCLGAPTFVVEKKKAVGMLSLACRMTLGKPSPFEASVLSCDNEKSISI